MDNNHVTKRKRAYTDSGDELEPSTKSHARTIGPRVNSPPTAAKATQPPKTILDCPTEVWLCIAKYCDRAALKSLSSASYLARQMTIAPLMENINMGGTQLSAAARLRTFLSSSPFIRRLPK